jgi:hypothetical protein
MVCNSLFKNVWCSSVPVKSIRISNRANASLILFVLLLNIRKSTKDILRGQLINTLFLIYFIFKDLCKKFFLSN